MIKASIPVKLCELSMRHRTRYPAIVCEGCPLGPNTSSGTTMPSLRRIASDPRTHCISQVAVIFLRSSSGRSPCFSALFRRPQRTRIAIKMLGYVQSAWIATGISQGPLNGKMQHKAILFSYERTFIICTFSVIVKSTHHHTHLTALRCAKIMEHATDMLNERTKPLIGITNVASARFRMESDIPRSSFPRTTAVFCDQSISPIATAEGERSLATTYGMPGSTKLRR